MRKIALILVIGLAFLLRILWLTKYPTGFTADEASLGYDAYSILKTGKDQWGQTFPLALRSFGDFKLPLYTYLTIPSVAIFGLNEFAVRLPGAILGTLAVLIVYLLTKELFKDDKLAFFASLILTISPWHLSLSRGAFEANLTTFFLPLAILLFLKGLVDKKYLILSALIFGLNLFSYHSARYVTPLIIVILTYWKRGLIKERYRDFLIPTIIFGIFLFLAAGVILGGGGSRAADVAIFNPTDNWHSVADERYKAVLVGLPDNIARFFSNKAIYILKQFTQNFLTYISLSFLFLQGAGEATYGMIPGYGVLYLVELLFLFAALVKYLKEKDEKIGLVIVWILVGFIPASLSKGSGYAANRAAVVMPAIQILSAYGGLFLLETLSEKFKSGWFKNFLPYGFVAILFISLIFFLEKYFYYAPAYVAPSMWYGRGEAAAFVKKIEGQYKEIIFSRSLSEPQIFVAFYQKWDPGDYQKESVDWLRYEKEGKPFLDQLGNYQLGKYRFSDINYQANRNKKDVLFVGKPEEFPSEIFPLKIIKYPDGNPAILIIDPTQQKYAKVF
jgi:4-amino-4-deoxy-L-arabinose transferase-like glycosyltransferase